MNRREVLLGAARLAPAIAAGAAGLGAGERKRGG